MNQSKIEINKKNSEQKLPMSSNDCFSCTTVESELSNANLALTVEVRPILCSLKK